ncbi:hypothetical protein [Methanosarcina sp. UBA5]|nr:hypothetical protein [Methanosarcina sp. UBA5]
MALDHSRGAAVYLDALKPHAILICGRGNTENPILWAVCLKNSPFLNRL